MANVSWAASRSAGGDKRNQRTCVFYINRERDTARRTALEKGLAEVGLSAERISAVEGLQVPQSLRPYFFTDGKLHSKLTRGEVGCYASHLSVMKTLIDRDIEHALILEDDAMLSADLPSMIDRILEALPPNWDLVHLCKDPCRATKKVANIARGVSLVRYSRVPATTTGYLLNKTGACKFLAQTNRYWPIDTDFRQPWMFGLEIYGVSHKLIAPNCEFESSIHAMGNHSRSRRGFPVPKSYCWTGNPLHTPRGVWFNLQRLGLRTWSSCISANTLHRLGRRGLS